jgi:hypothetical protein
MTDDTSPTPPSQPTQPSGVPVGVATQTGYAVAVAGLIAAILAYATGDHSQAQLGSIIGGAIGLISLTITQIGRYVQANSQIKANVELKRVEVQALSVGRLVQADDPNAVAQLHSLVRSVLQEEIRQLPAGTRTVATDVENSLLPSPQEEAAAPPPAAGNQAAGGA